MNGRLQKSFSADDAFQWKKVNDSTMKNRQTLSASDEKKQTQISTTKRGKHGKKADDGNETRLNADTGIQNENGELSTKVIRQGCRRWLKELLVKYLSSDDMKQPMLLKAVPSAAESSPRSNDKEHPLPILFHKAASLDDSLKSLEPNCKKITKKRLHNCMHSSAKATHDCQMSSLNFSQGDWKNPVRVSKTDNQEALVDIEKMTNIFESFLKSEFTEEKSSKWKYLIEKELKTIQNIATSQRETQAFPLWESTAALAQTTKDYLSSAFAKLSPTIAGTSKEEEKEEEEEEEGSDQNANENEEENEESPSAEKKGKNSRFVLKKKQLQKEESSVGKESQQDPYDRNVGNAVVLHKVKPMKSKKDKKPSRIRVIVEDKEYKIHRELFAEHSEAFRRALSMRANVLPVAIALEDVTREQFKTIRDWMYGEESAVNESNAKEILEVANKLQMEELCRKCQWLVRKKGGADTEEEIEEKSEREGKTSESAGEDKTEDKAVGGEEEKKEGDKRKKKEKEKDERKSKRKEDKQKEKKKEKKKEKEKKKKEKRKKEEKEKKKKEKSKTKEEKKKEEEQEEQEEQEQEEETDKPEEVKEERDKRKEKEERGVMTDEREIVSTGTETEDEEKTKNMEDKETVTESKDIEIYCRKFKKPKKGSVCYWNIDPGCEVHYDMLTAKENEYREQKRKEEEKEQERRKHHVHRKTYLVERRKCEKEDLPWCKTPRHRRFREQPKPVVKKELPMENVACAGDIVLIVDKHRIYVNRMMAQKHSRCLNNILAQKGPVKTSSVVVEGIREWVMRDIADWLNGGSLCLTPKNVSCFVDAAKKLDMPLLLHKCRHYQLQVDEGFCEAVMIPPEEMGHEESFLETCGKAVSNLAKSVWNRTPCEEGKETPQRLRDSQCSSESSSADISVSSSSSTTTRTTISSDESPLKTKKKKSLSWKEDEFCARTVKPFTYEETKTRTKRPRKKTYHSDDEKCLAVYIKPMSSVSSTEATESSVASKTLDKVTSFLCGMAQCKDADTRLGSVMEILKECNNVAIGESFCGGNFGTQHSHRITNKGSVKSTKFPFDPNRYHWVISSPLSMCHAFSAAVIFKEKLYVSGGRTVQNHSARRGPEAVTCIWRFDLEAMVWNHVAYMTTARIHHTMAVFDNAIYIVGGIDDKLRIISSVECFHPECGLVSSRAPLSVPRAGVSTIAYDNLLWVAGGLLDPCTSSPGFHAVDLVERYDAAQDRWCSYHPLNVPRAFATMIVFHDQLFIIGGVTLVAKVASHTEAIDTVETVEIFESTTRSWICLSDLERPRYCANAVVQECSIYVFGGMDLPTGTLVNEIEHLCHDTHQWTSADTQFTKKLQTKLYD